MMAIKRELRMSDDMLIRVETADYDRMEEVRPGFLCFMNGLQV